MPDRFTRADVADPQFAVVNKASQGISRGKGVCCCCHTAMTFVCVRAFNDVNQDNERANCSVVLLECDGAFGRAFGSSLNRNLAVSSSGTGGSGMGSSRFG